jgi:hypothetical protein
MSGQRLDLRMLDRFPRFVFVEPWRGPIGSVALLWLLAACLTGAAFYRLRRS